MRRLQDLTKEKERPYRELYKNHFTEKNNPKLETSTCPLYFIVISLLNNIFI